MIIATAGHVDHGKTTLLRALTGVDADRLPEEKRRGMTIDLGYAYLSLQEGKVLGFIDVPGHEKFLANMLAGIGGISHVLLAVACDDGVMAQTREHLTLLRLAGKPALSVALTKADCVDAARVNDVYQQVEQELQKQGWYDTPLFVTAAASGEGIDALRDHLITLSLIPQRLDHRFRLAIDRVFSVKGAGLVVTGTSLAGRVSEGDTLWLTGSNRSVRVRGIHAQNQPVEQAHSGQRIALNITGDVDKAHIARGDWLLAQRPPVAPAERVLVVLDLLTPIQHWQPVHLHHAASHITGRVSLLEETANGVTLAELVLDTPLWLVEDDCLILRDISARRTLAGARVIQLTAPRRGKRQPEFIDWLRQLVATRDDAGSLALRLPRGTLSVPYFAWARQLENSTCTNLLHQNGTLLTGDYALAQELVLRYQQRLLEVLEQFHQQHADQMGVGRARLRRMALPSEPETLVFTLIDSLLAAGKLTNTRGWLHLPQHSLAFSPEQQALWVCTEPLFGDDACWVRDLAVHTGVDEDDMRQMLRKAALLGYIIAIVRDRYYLTGRIRQFADLIRAMDAIQGSTSVADFRDQLGVGRKLAIQILEFFDYSGFTRRKGNQHVLRDRGLFGEG